MHANSSASARLQTMAHRSQYAHVASTSSPVARVSAPKSSKPRAWTLARFRSRHDERSLLLGLSRSPSARFRSIARAKKTYESAKDAEEDLLFWNEEDLEDDDDALASEADDFEDDDEEEDDDDWLFVPTGANVSVSNEDLFNIDDEDGNGGYVMDFVKMSKRGVDEASGAVNTSSRSPKKRGDKFGEASASAAPKRIVGETGEIESKADPNAMKPEDVQRMVAMGVPLELLLQIEEEKKEIEAFNKRKEYEASRRTHKRLTIVAGTFGKRKLLSPSGLDTRPMMSMVRGATFDMLLNFLGSRSNVQFPANSRWLDLFCGTGAIGIEAISRGVEDAHFVEMDPWVTGNVTSKNLASFGLTKQTTIHTASVEAFLTQHHKSARGVGGAFDFISFCPPYEKVSYPELLLQLDQSSLVKDSTVIVVEYAKGQAADIQPSIGKRLRRVRDRRYGRTFVAMYVCDGRDLDVEFEDGPEVATKFNKAVFARRD